VIQHHSKQNVMYQKNQRRTFLKRIAGAAGLLALASAGRATEFAGTIAGDHDIYQEYPAHRAFIENASHLWTRVQVYDSVSCAS